MNKEVIIYDKNEKPIKINIKNFEDVEYIELFIFDKNEELRVSYKNNRVTLPPCESKVRTIPMLRTCIYDKSSGINLLDNERWINRFNDKYENSILENFKLIEITDQMNNDLWIRYTLGCKSDVPGNWYIDIYFEDKIRDIVKYCIRFLINNNYKNIDDEAIMMVKVYDLMYQYDKHDIKLKKYIYTFDKYKHQKYVMKMLNILIDGYDYGEYKKVTKIAIDYFNDVLKNENERNDVDIEEIFNDNDNLKFSVCY